MPFAVLGNTAKSSLGDDPVTVFQGDLQWKDATQLKVGSGLSQWFQANFTKATDVYTFKNDQQIAIRSNWLFGNQEVYYHFSVSSFNGKLNYRISDLQVMQVGDKRSNYRSTEIPVGDFLSNPKNKAMVDQAGKQLIESLSQTVSLLMN